MTMTTDTTTTRDVRGVTPAWFPSRWYRAWTRRCDTCDRTETLSLPLSITVKCPWGHGTMTQAPWGAPPDIEEATEWTRR